MEIFSIGYALLAVQRALLEAATPELRAVIIDICEEDHSLYARFYYDGDVSEELIELWNCALTETSAALGYGCTVDEDIIRLDYPKEIPVRGSLAYLRKEPGGENVSFPFKLKENPISEFSIAEAMLVVQRTLLGVVTPELRAVVVDLLEEERLLYVHFYYDGQVPDTLIDLWNDAATRARTILDPECLLDAGAERVDYPLEMPFRGRFAYLRKEERL